MGLIFHFCNKGCNNRCLFKPSSEYLCAYWVTSVLWKATNVFLFVGEHPPEGSHDCVCWPYCGYNSSKYSLYRCANRNKNQKGPISSFLSTLTTLWIWPLIFFFFSLQCLSFQFHSKLLSCLKIHNNSFLNVLLGANSDYLQRHTSLCSYFRLPILG